MTPLPQVRSRPRRRHAAYDVHFGSALIAGLVATLAFLALYYLTLGLLPWAFAYPTTPWPVEAWAHRFDLAQFIGSFLHPPYPTPFTWLFGFAVMAGSLVGLGLVYAVLLSWSLQPSDAGKGLGFGLAAGIGLIGFVSIANGLHPAVMRNALADPGLFLLGWSNWAPVQILVAHAAYGLVLGKLYNQQPGSPPAG